MLCVHIVSSRRVYNHHKVNLKRKKEKFLFFQTKDPDSFLYILKSV